MQHLVWKDNLQSSKCGIIDILNTHVSLTYGTGECCMMILLWRQESNEEFIAQLWQQSAPADPIPANLISSENQTV